MGGREAPPTSRGPLLIEFFHNVGMVCATVLAAAAVTFGIRAGLEFAHWVFGPFKINVNGKQTYIVVHGDDAAQHRTSEEK